MNSALQAHFDHIEEGRFIGWAWLPNFPEEVVQIDILLDRTIIGTGEADHFRGDLEKADKRNGFCGFDIPVAHCHGRVVVRASWSQGSLDLMEDDFDFPTAQIETSKLPIYRHSAHMAGAIDQIGPLTLTGWIQSTRNPAEQPVIELICDTEMVLRFTADIWRSDLDDLRLGDGRWGYAAELPRALLDGKLHRLDLKLARGGHLLVSPIDIKLPVAETVTQLHFAKTDKLPKPRRPSRRRPEISIIVNFYNMRREAARTLRSLSRDYQRGIDDLAYEVICVDNGSATPLDEAWISSFGPEFRLVRPAQPKPSPCHALNAAARSARGRYIAVMIDGAHVLTPGVLAEAAIHLRAVRSAVVALRHWFVGGDQRWLASAGYASTREDLLFDRIAWPSNGYELFRIGSPIGESPNSWFDGLGESNCLFMPTALWRRIGGFDENFKVAGGGFANLDLLKRAAAQSRGGVVCLVGEATFHQYHGGTTTNVTDTVKDERVDAYGREYRALRGTAFEGLDPSEFRLAGRMVSEHAAVVRQRPLFPAPLAVTDRIRPVSRRQLLDLGAERYIQGSYVELGLQETTRWLGQPVDLAPTDVLAILDIIGRVRPTCIVTTSTDVRLLQFLDSACEMLDLHGTPIVQAGGTPDADAPRRVAVVAGDPWSEDTLRHVERRIETAEEVLVLFEPPSAPGAPVGPLADYASLVSYGSYIIYLGTARGQPWLGYSTRWPLKAIRSLTERSGRYAIDHTFDQHFVTTCPSGYIRRIGGLVELASDDPALDVLELL